ncbi:TonB family protein [bacterium]|nr:TonB family protein [bacterium]MCI0605630.1 TonB family protein [bacterium]
MPEKKNTIGRFEIIEKIGEGPIGAVYKALDPVIRRTVAIKVIKLYALEETTTFAEVFEKIYRVVRTSTSLNHPNICIIYDLSEEKKIPYITMEYVEGHDLESLLRQKHQFKRSEFLNVLQQTCDALDFAHKKNVIHQDFKSTNILITSDLHVKITDFGIAGLDEIAAAQTKKLLSIPHYISPEQALGERVSPASDLFSLGVVVYHMLSGELPFPGTTAANTIMMIARDVPATPANLDRFSITREDWNSFFSIALAKSPNQRFRSAREMLEALNSILPSSDQTYYPFGFEGSLNESTGKFEKTYIAEEEAESASPTLMIDASQIMEESGPEINPELVKLEQEAHLFLDANTAEIGKEEQQPITEPVETAPSVEQSLAMAEAAPVMELVTLRESEFKEEIKLETTQKPGAVEEKAIEIPVEQKTELIEMPFGAAVDLSVEEPRVSETIAAGDPASMPSDFVPASGNLMEMEGLDSEEMATIPPSPRAEIAVPASDTSPIGGPPEQKPVSIPTQLVEEFEPEQSKGNGRAQEPFDEVPATMIGNFKPPEPEPEKEAPAPATVLVPRPAPVQEPVPIEPPQEILSVPTKMMRDIPPIAAAPEVPRPAPEPPRPAPVVPPSAPAEPVHPLTKPIESRPAAAAKPPSMQRYFYGAIAVVIFIALIGGAILFFRKPDVPGPTPETPEQTAQTKKDVPKPVEREPQPMEVEGSIMVTSDPAGATVFLAGEEKGVTPVEIPQLALGKHLVKLQLKGYQDLEQEVELSEQSPNASLPMTLQKTAAASGTLIVESEPAGAFIVLANRVLGVTPKSFTRKPGNYSITLKKDGYQDYTGSITVAQDKKVTFKGTLAEIPKPVPVVEVPKPKPPEVTRGQLVTLGPDVVPPKPTKKVYAKYPDAAKARKLEGTVRLNVLIDETGRVLDIKVGKSSGHTMLDEAVVKAYREWQFAPATKQNVPVKVWITVAMSFQSGR